MMLVVLEVGGSWESLDSLFKIRAATFQRLISKFVPIFYEWGLKQGERLSMKFLASKISNLKILQMKAMLQM